MKPSIKNTLSDTAFGLVIKLGLVISLMISTLSFASDGSEHSSEHSAEHGEQSFSAQKMTNTKTATQSWHSDADLVYREKSAPQVLGFLPVNQHSNNAGLGLDHFNLSYQLNNYSINERALKKSLAQDSALTLNAKIDLAWHSNNLEIQQAWLQNQWQSSALKLGKFYPRIGFLNQVHHQGFLSAPLVNRTFWGEQLAESGAEFQYQIKSSSLEFRQFANVLGGQHLNSKKDTLAFLYQAELQQKLSDASQVTLLANVYYSEVADRGLSLFDLTSTAHSHSNLQFTEFFDGSIRQLSAGIQWQYQTGLGDWQYQVEYSQRQETGRLYNNSANLAKLDLASEGSYQQIYWQGPNKKWQAGLRHNYLYSDVTVSDTSDNSLDNSRLNPLLKSKAGNQDTTPQTFDLMLAYEINQQQKLQLIYSDNIDWQTYAQRVELHYQIRLH